MTRRGRDASSCRDPFSVERVSGSGFRTTRVTGLKVFSTVFKHFSKTRISKFPRFLSSAASSRSPATITGFGTGTALSLSLLLSLYPGLKRERPSNFHHGITGHDRNVDENVEEERRWWRKIFGPVAGTTTYSTETLY